MLEPDFSTFSFTPVTETPTGQYYLLRPNSSRRSAFSARFPDTYFAKVYFTPLEIAQGYAEMWASINRCVSNTVRVVATLMRDGRRALVFKYRPTRMCDVLDTAGELDLTFQALRCTFVARTVLELHTEAMYVHTRLHPKRFYIDSDGRFKLGHFSQAVVIDGSEDANRLKAEERVCLGKLMVYLMTNIPFDKLLLWSPIEVVDELSRYKFPETVQRIKSMIAALLVPRDGLGSDSDIAKVLSLGEELMPETFDLALESKSDTPERHQDDSVCCSGCRQNCMLKPGKQWVELHCSHNCCFTCVFKAMARVRSREEVFKCFVCDASIKAGEVVDSFPDPKARERLNAIFTAAG